METHPTLPSASDAEYTALRDTIRARGTVRMLLLPIGLIGWAALAIGAGAVITVALSTLVPLLALAGTFEAIFALHVNVERIGRYIQVFHEPGHGAWEHTSMAFGRQFPGSGPDPLFARLFVFAASINFFPAALGGEMWEVVVIGICHFAFIYRVRRAQQFAGHQREADLQRFKTLLAQTRTTGADAGQTPSSTRLTE
jgi:hypothetical protein